MSSYPKGDRGDRGVLTHPLGLTTVAFVVTAIPTILLTKVIGRHLESLPVMGWSLVVGGIVMWAVDVAVGGGEPGSGVSARVRTRSMEDMSLAQAAWVGACQVVAAVFPGTSRSMATIAGGQLAGMSRLAALEFSFFLSMPTMALATGYDLLKSTVGGEENPIGVTQIDAHGWAVLTTGLVVSFIVAYASVAWLMTWVRRHGFVPFAIYRVVVGVLVLLWASGFLGSETQSLSSRSGAAHLTSQVHPPEQRVSQPAGRARYAAGRSRAAHRLGSPPGAPASEGQPGCGRLPLQRRRYSQFVYPVDGCSP